jgi:hypothetical protein
VPTVKGGRVEKLKAKIYPGKHKLNSASFHLKGQCHKIYNVGFFFFINIFLWSHKRFKLRRFPFFKIFMEIIGFEIVSGCLRHKKICGIRKMI